MMNGTNWTWLRLVPIALLLLCGVVVAETKRSGAVAYLELLGKGVAAGRKQIPAMTATAGEAAKRLLAGGAIWVAGPQKDFQIEAYTRAGGLMRLKMLEKSTPAAGDILLYGAAVLQADDCKKIRAWEKAGVHVVAFAAKPAAMKAAELPTSLIEPGPSPGLPVKDAGQDKLCPVDTVVNAVNLWAWTGELAAACTRAGKMHVFYQSHALPGGRERSAKYPGKTFHDDLAVKPIPPGRLAKAYLDYIDKSLASLRASQMDRIAKTAQWWREAKPEATTALIIGHMFPDHFLDPRAPKGPAMGPTWHDRKLEGKLDPDRFVLYIGYQQAPQLIVDQAVAAKFRFVYFTVRPASPPEPAANVIYIDPGWPLDDGCVIVPGYDVPILPASGVMSAAIYWATLAEVCRTDGLQSDPTTRPR